MPLIFFLILFVAYFCFTFYFSATKPSVSFNKNTPLEPYFLENAIFHFKTKLSEEDNCYYSDLIFYSKTYKHTCEKLENVLVYHKPHYWGSFFFATCFAVADFLYCFEWRKEDWLFYVISFASAIILIILFCFLMNRYLEHYDYNENTLEAIVSITEPSSTKCSRFPYSRYVSESFHSDYLISQETGLHYSMFNSFSEYIKAEYDYSAKILTGRINAMEAQIEFLLSEPKKHIIGSLAFLAVYFWLI